MRWHPMIVRWCLFMRQKSTKAYDAMRESGFINLPSSRTLYDYSHYTKSTLGIQPDVIKIFGPQITFLDRPNDKTTYTIHHDYQMTFFALLLTVEQVAHLLNPKGTIAQN
ncbi:hypothetical protein KUTeg_011729 [Tegillarca granosa]|uniref:Uncharacterized protein n=1 Tax=Tegillarca granosa TaxID=220873 RepID=A0ABQ9EXG3_TEGGR|nr:hypothetical protein KUTeg_011729 [Tegillarca granosa]